MQSNLANYLPLTGGTLSGNLNMGGHQIENVKSIEMFTSAAANHGGFIDFHFNRSTKDFTSRIIESAEGKIDITAPTGVYANGKNIVRSVNGTVAGTDGNVDLTYYRKAGTTISKAAPDFQYNTGKSITLESLDSSDISYVKVMQLTVAGATISALNGWVWKNGYVPSVAANDTLIACRIGSYGFLQVI